MEFHPRLENKLTFRPGLEFLILPVKQLLNTSAKKSESSSPIAVADAWSAEPGDSTLGLLHRKEEKQAVTKAPFCLARSPPLASSSFAFKATV